jgi:hypothetical protein
MQLFSQGFVFSQKLVSVTVWFANRLLTLLSVNYHRFDWRYFVLCTFSGPNFILHDLRF